MSSFYLAMFPRVTTDIHLKEPKKKGIKARGYDFDRRPAHKTLLTEQEVLEARWLHEFAFWTVRRVAEHYNVSYSYALNLLSYATRGKIVPTKDSFPSGHIPVSLPGSPKD